MTIVELLTDAFSQGPERFIAILAGENFVHDLVVVILGCWVN